MNAEVQLPAGVTVLERGWLSSNNVVFRTGVTAVVDTGYVAHAEQTVALVRNELGVLPLDLIVNTHLHSDHCGANAALKSAYPSAQTIIPPGDADAVARWDEETLSYAATGQECARFSFDGLLHPGLKVTLGDLEWEIHSAPGHDPHSVILFEPLTRSLIAADALWQDGFGIVFPELHGEPGFGQVAATFDLIESLRPRSVVPGHGQPFGGEQIAVALEIARSRLARQIAEPQRHALHAMKVLLKFRLLAWQAVPFETLLSWAGDMPYMRAVRDRFRFSAPFPEWIAGLIAELERRGALRREGSMIYNV